MSYEIGVWLSLVERYVRDVEVASSNLVTPTWKRSEQSLLFLLYFRAFSDIWLIFIFKFFLVYKVNFVPFFACSKKCSKKSNK